MQLKEVQRVGGYDVPVSVSANTGGCSPTRRKVMEFLQQTGMQNISSAHS